MKVQILEGFGIKALYFVDINDYIVITDDSILDKIDINREIADNDLIELIKDYFPNKLTEVIQLIAKSKMPRDKSTGASEYTICIHPSRKCNLRCKYCFGKDEYLPCGEIDIETAKKAVDFIVFDYGSNGSMYTVDLSGSGEPLLRFDFIKELDEYCDQLRDKTGKEICIQFATNATLITDEIAEFLKNSKCIVWGVSIDGNESQNSNRQFKSGMPIYDELIKGIDKLKYDLLGLAATITSNNQDIDEVYSSLYSIGASAISMHYVRDFDKSSATSIYNIDIDNLMLHYHKLFDLLLDHIKAGDNEFIKPLLRGDDYLGVLLTRVFFVGDLPSFRCPAGKSKITVNEKGDLYACSVMNGNKAFYIGDIYNGINSKLQAKFFEINIDSNEKCRNCWCRNNCAGECMANAYLEHNDFFEPNEFLCNLKYRLIPLSITFVEHLKQNYPSAYITIRNHAISMISFQNTDSAIWSVLKFLQNHKKKIKFSEVKEHLSKEKHSINGAKVGTPPKFVAQYLSNCNKNFFAVQLDDTSNNDIGVFNQMKDFPIIAYINKIPTTYYTYVLVEKANIDKIFFRFLQSMEIIEIPTIDFLNNYSDVFIGNFGYINKNITR